jgi:hypothetical protein
VECVDAILVWDAPQGVAVLEPTFHAIVVVPAMETVVITTILNYAIKYVHYRSFQNQGDMEKLHKNDEGLYKFIP